MAASGACSGIRSDPPKTISRGHFAVLFRVPFFFELLDLGSEGLLDGLAPQKLKTLAFKVCANASFQYLEALVGLLGSILAALGPIWSPEGVPKWFRK